MTLSKITDNPEHHLGGASGLVFERIQIDAWAEDPDTLRDLVDAIRNRLDGYRGTVTIAQAGNEAGGSIEIDAIIRLDGSDSADQPTDGKDLGAMNERMDFRISAAEPIPSLT